MAQPSVASYFNTRKRAQVDSPASIKARRLTEESRNKTVETAGTQSEQQHDEIADLKAAMRTRSGRTVKRIAAPPLAAEKKDAANAPPRHKTIKVEQSDKQPKMEAFMTKGTVTPSSKSSTAASNKVDLQQLNEKTPSTANTIAATLEQNLTATKSDAANVERGLQTPTKQIIKGSGEAALKQVELKSLVRKELNFDDVKTKVTRSAKLQELKASLGRIQELEKSRKAAEERNRRLREGIPASPAKKTPVVQLKEFETIELEVLTSPAKTFKTPTKLPPPTPDKNELMSPRHTDLSKRVLFSPAKKGSPAKLIVPPAYQRFMALTETSKAGQLILPFKYRHLIELFKGVDSVCAMFHNRKECITFKKLRPAVQRMLRKNFSETHLAQIRHIFPDAFIFTQMKMRNYGSTSKADYFQLVITPNVDSGSEKAMKTVIMEAAAADAVIDEENVLSSAQANAMNPQVMTERLRYFQHMLLQRVKEEHDKFLKALDPPLSIAMAKVTRWHPDFDLENCPDIECAHLPQPPNMEKYSSARDILSTARNLFNCSTPMERALERYEAKLQADRAAAGNDQKHVKVETEIKPLPTGVLVDVKPAVQPVTAAPSAVISKTAAPASTAGTGANDVTATLLKGLPQSLVDKIRAKQAAKALDAMTRRPSQDQEATKYSRLPELARHLRNVFITERKGVLTLEIVIKKIQNSFRTCLTPLEIETHLRLIAKEVPTWATFHEVRKTMYLKIAKDMDLNKVVAALEVAANEKSK